MSRVKDIALFAGMLAIAVLIANFFLSEEPSELTEEPLTATEASRVVVEDRKISVLSKKGTKAAYVPSSGHAVVSTSKDGDVKISVKQAGFSLQSGLGGSYADTGRFTLDLQIAYWRRIGFHAGVGFADAHPAAVPFFAVSYKLDQLRLTNTSLFVGVTTRKEPVFGVRVEL